MFLGSLDAWRAAANANGGRNKLAEDILEQAKRPGVCERVGAEEWTRKLVTDAMNNHLKARTKRPRPPQTAPVATITTSEGRLEVAFLLLL
jgi:hypothetical protein